MGLVVSSALNLIIIFSNGVNQSAELDNQLVSVERVREYSKIEPEGPWEIPGMCAYTYYFYTIVMLICSLKLK